MINLDYIRSGIADGRISFDEINSAIIDGIKLQYGVQDFHFCRGYIPGTLMDGYSPINTTPIRGQTYFSDCDTWICSTEKNIKYREIDDPKGLDYLLSDFSRGKMKVYFIDTTKEYDNLYDLRHDYLAKKLAGV